MTTKIRILMITAVVVISLPGLCQAQTDNCNYSSETVILSPGIRTDSQVESLGVGEAISLIAYYDAFGYPVQEVTVGGSADGRHDLVLHREYDDYRRESRSFLPYADYAEVPSGSFRNAALSGTLNYYSPSSGQSAVRTASPFAVTVFEQSLLDRELQLGAPGEAWQPASVRETSGRTIVTEYGTCSASGQDAVRKWNVTASGLSCTGNWSPGSLRRLTAKDENWTSDRKGTCDVFTDMLGLTLLERRWLSEDEPLDTYYVYDELGRLRYVLPPMLSAHLSGMSSVADAAEQMKKLGYAYRYDGAGNCIWKRLPGCEPVVTVYDTALRPVITQDGNQRARGEWSMTFYDGLGRPAVSGICTQDMSAEARKDVFTATFKGNGPYYGYELYPKTLAGAFIAKDVRFYDDYDFLSIWDDDIKKSLSFSTIEGYDVQCWIAYGLETGSIQFPLGGPVRPVLSAYHYDDRGRCIQVSTVNHLGGTDRTTMSYSFTGNIVKSHSSHSAGTSSETVEETYTNTYDHLDRLLTRKHRVGDNAEATVADYVYDDIGNIVSDRRNGSKALVTSYGYNIRGWQTSIQNGVFRERLSYEDTRSIANAVPQYDGGIAAMQWTVCDAVPKTYTFGYDAVGRLSEAFYTCLSPESSSTERYAYDWHGNMTGSTKENGSSFEKLTFSHDGNRLSSVILSLPGKPDKKSGVFGYDANGNMISDVMPLHDGSDNVVNISYNRLNLASDCIFGTGTDMTTVRYSYTPDGTKLQVKVTDGDDVSVTDYCSNVVYRNGELQRIMIDGGYVEDGQYRFFVTDHLGSIRAVTDANGTVLQTLDYTPYGKAVEDESCPVNAPDVGSQPYRFNGKESQEFAGLPYLDYGARFYSPGMSRWTTPDPLAEKYYHISPYAYCANNPLKYIDPDGMDWYSYQKAVQDENGNEVYQTQYAWTDATSQEELIESGVENGTYLGEAVVVFDGSLNERLGTKESDPDGLYIDGDGAVTANVTVYGPNGENDIQNYTGFTMSSNPAIFGVVSNGEYWVNRINIGERSGPYESEWTVNNRGKVPAMNNFNPAYPDRKPGYLNGVFIHRTNWNGFAGTYYSKNYNRIAGVSEGCLLIAPQHWNSFSRQLSNVTAFRLIINRSVHR